MRATSFDPGQMSARLELEMREDASDGQGGAVTGFAVVDARSGRGSSRFRPGDEERADEEVFTVTHRIWMRFREDLRRGHAVSQGRSDFCDLRAWYDPDETRRYLVCQCAEEGR